MERGIDHDRIVGTTKESTRTNLVVFQCGKCLSIIGDSTAWHSANMEMKTMTLERVTEVVRVREDIQISRQGPDSGSTYNVVYCKKCNTDLGRKYLASCSNMDMTRGFITFLAERVSSYELGSCETTYIGPTEEVISNIQTGIQEKISTLMLLSVSTNERLSRLEQAVLGKENSATNTSSQPALSSVNNNIESTAAGYYQEMNASNKRQKGAVPPSHKVQEKIAAEHPDSHLEEDSDHIDSISDADSYGSDIPSVSQVGFEQPVHSVNATVVSKPARELHREEVYRNKRDASSERQKVGQKRRRPMRHDNQASSSDSSVIDDHKREVKSRYRSAAQYSYDKADDHPSLLRDLDIENKRPEGTDQCSTVALDYYPEDREGRKGASDTEYRKQVDRQEMGKGVVVRGDYTRPLGQRDEARMSRDVHYRRHRKH